MSNTQPATLSVQSKLNPPPIENTGKISKIQVEMSGFCHKVHNLASGQATIYQQSKVAMWAVEDRMKLWNKGRGGWNKGQGGGREEGRMKEEERE